MTYKEALDYLYNQLPVFHNIGSAAYKPGLDNTIRLMNVLNNPQKCYRAIHIAGTNGKGSVSHYLAAILEVAGYKVGLYTSPHLVDFGERIRVNGKMIEQQYVVDFIKNNQPSIDKIQPSFFEVTMAMAFKYFADSEIDIAIIEVGLGGRLDSTNIIEPDLSIITNISFDHVGFLGNSLGKIAFEKAGIIKPNTPVVIGEALPETRPVFEQKAREENAPIYFAEENYQVLKKENPTNNGKMIVDVFSNKNKIREYRTELSGIYQLKNIATVLTAIDILNNKIVENSFPSPETGKTISTNAINNGFENVVKLTGLQGRWQIVQRNPTVICDTGHNEAGIKTVMEQLSKEDYNHLHIVIGMVNDKDISSVLALLPKGANYYFTQANVQRAVNASQLHEMAQKFQLSGSKYDTIESAIKHVLRLAEPNDLVFIGGSNFVVGEALMFLIKK